MARALDFAPPEPSSAAPPDNSFDRVLDAGLAAAFRAAPQSAGMSVLHSLGGRLSRTPQVRLRDVAGEERATGAIEPSGDRPAAAGYSSPSGTGGTRYKILGEIARGGMGAVHIGRDIDLQRDIAVKVLLEDHKHNPELLERFVEEAQVGGQLQHPGIVPVYELGQFADQRLYFTMKLVKGQTLARLLAQRPEVERDRMRFLKIFEQVCQTLAYAHARGVIHRDLKPSNIMVGSFGEVQVMDWGLAKVLSEARSAAPTETTLPAAAEAVHTIRSDTASAASSSTHTQAGSVLGTPSYMAPEQARGAVEEIDERTDVFGLGAILCEILTGEPPFTGSGSEPRRKAQAAQLDEAFERLDRCGAEPELVQLARACLAANAHERPAHAGQVAEQMAAYLESVEARLRKAEVEKAAAEAKMIEERKRRRATVALAGAVLAFMLLAGVSLAQWWREQSDIERDVQAALAEASRHQQAGRWQDARAALERAQGRLGTGGTDELRDRVRAARNDADMVGLLDDIWLRQSEVRQGNFDFRSADAAYAAAFKQFDIDVSSLAPVEAARRIQQSAIAGELLAALDNWASVKPAKDSQRDVLREVANAADSDLWRRDFRAALAEKNKEKMLDLAKRQQALEQPPAVLSLFARALIRAGLAEEGVELLREAQKRYPSDFWINHDLAFNLAWMVPGRGSQSIGYYRAAVALRPRSPGVHLNLGMALQAQKDLAGAAECYRQAIALDQKYASAHVNLGNVLGAMGDKEGALQSYVNAVMADPDHAPGCYNLGLALHERGDLMRAIECYRQAMRIEPRHVFAKINLGIVLRDLGDLDAALVHHREAVEQAPRYDNAHLSLAVDQTQAGDLEGAEASYRTVIEIKPDHAEAWCNLGHILWRKASFEEALEAFQRGHELGSPRPDWNPSEKWVEEAKRLVELNSKLSEILTGQVKPENLEDRLLFARLGYYTGNYGHAVQWYGEALAPNEAAPHELAGDSLSSVRYGAACSAALAGSGKGLDRQLFSDAERAAFRSQALGWLKSELELESERLQTDDLPKRVQVQARLWQWLREVDLAGIRDTDALATLPAEERATLQQFWIEVRAAAEKPHEAQLP